MEKKKKKNNIKTHILQMIINFEISIIICEKKFNFNYKQLLLTLILLLLYNTSN